MFEEYVLPSPKYESRSFQCLYLYFHFYGSVSSIDCPVADVSKIRRHNLKSVFMVLFV